MDQPATGDNLPRDIVTLSGELDLAREAEIHRRLVIDSTGDVVADLSGVTFVDSSGLRSLLRARQELTEHGRSLSLANPTDPVRRLLEITHTDDIFTII